MSNLRGNNVTVRRATAADGERLARLAALDSGPVPQPPALVAEADGRLLAALPLGSGHPVADPFVRSGELVELLRLRARQLSATRRHGKRGLLRRARPATA